MAEGVQESRRQDGQDWLVGELASRARLAEEDWPLGELVSRARLAEQDWPLGRPALQV